MQINIDQYIRNFRIFYQQLVKNHKHQEILNKQFKLLIENELKKWKRAHGLSRISDTSSENTLLNKLKQNRKNKEQIKINIQIQYSSQKVQNCVAFGYLYIIFQYKNAAAFTYIQQQLKGPLAEKQGYTPQMLRKVNFAWSKFSEMMSGKRRMVRFDQQLKQYFKQLPQLFIDQLYKIIIQETVFVPENPNVYFEELSQYLALRIQYFEINEQQAIKNTTYGENQKLVMKIGYLKRQNVFINVSKLPEKQQKQVNKQITLQKLSHISTHLNEMYSLNMKQYLNLSNIKNRGEITNRLIESRNTQLKSSRKSQNHDLGDFGDI